MAEEERIVIIERGFTVVNGTNLYARHVDVFDVEKLFNCVLWRVAVKGSIVVEDSEDVVE